MSRFEAVVHIARFARGIIDVRRAEVISEACGVKFDMLLYVDPDLARDTIEGGYVIEEGVGKKVVKVSELGATLCRYMGLYAGRDHAMSSPHATPGKEADYVGQRAAIRLARQWWGEEGVRDLRQEVPWLPPVLLQERPHTPAGVKN